MSLGLGLGLYKSINFGTLFRPPLYSSLVGYYKGDLINIDDLYYLRDYKNTGTYRAPQIGYCVDANGTDYLAVDELVGTETVVSYDGTSTPSISAGRIDFTAGEIGNLLLSNGSFYPFEEKSGKISYDVVNGYHGSWKNAGGTTIELNYAENPAYKSYNNLFGFNGQSSMKFNGTDNYIQLFSLPPQAPQTLRFKCTFIVSNTGVLLGRHADFANSSGTVRLYENGGNRYLSFIATTDIEDTSHPVSLNEWHTVDVLFTSGTDSISVTLDGNNFSVSEGVVYTLQYWSKTLLGASGTSVIQQKLDGNISNAEIYLDDVLVGSYGFAESDDNVLVDLSGNGNDGTIIGTKDGDIAGTYYSEAPYFTSRLVEGESTGTDFSGAMLKWSGSAPKHALAKDYALSVGATTEITIAELVGDETVVSYRGEQEPSVAVGKLTFAGSGVCSLVELSNGSIYPLNEGAGTTAYDVVNGYDGTISNGSYAISEYSSFWNYLYGAYYDGTKHIPALEDKSEAADGSALNRIAGVWDDNINTVFNFPICPELYLSDSYISAIYGDGYLFNAAGDTQKDITYADRNENVYDNKYTKANVIFSDVSTDYKWRNIVIYSEPISIENINKVLNFVKGTKYTIDQITDNSGEVITDNSGNELKQYTR